MDVQGQLCYADAYVRTVDARVEAVDDGGAAPLIILDRTVFYARGGGQPGDTGLLLRAADGRSWVVRAARKESANTISSETPSAVAQPPGSPLCNDSSVMTPIP